MKTTHLLIGLNTLIFLVMLKVAGTGELTGFSTRTWLEFGANYGPLVVRGGQWWRLVTSMFIHGGVAHLAMNMIAIWQCGVVLERHFGRARFLLIYFLAGLGGAVASLAWHWRDAVPSAGASGAGCGLVAAGAVAGHLLLGLDGTARRYRDAMVRWLIMIGAFGFFVGGIDNAAHIGGAATGAGLAWLMDRNIGALKRAQAKQREAGVGIEAFLLVAILGGCFWLAARARGDSFTPGELINQGVEKSHAKQSAEAIALFEKALKLEPNEDIAHYDLALELERNGEFSGCIEHAREAERIEPKAEYRELAEECGALPRHLLKLMEPDGGTDDE
jgi:membrane associated rhomboid family serine protease